MWKLIVLVLFVCTVPVSALAIQDGTKSKDTPKAEEKKLTPEQENKLLKLLNELNTLDARRNRDRAQASELTKDADSVDKQFELVQPLFKAALDEATKSFGPPPAGKQWTPQASQDGGIAIVLTDAPVQKPEPVKTEQAKAAPLAKQ